MTDTFQVDATELTRWGRKAATQWAAIARDEYGRGLQRAGHRVRNAGNRRINRWHGELQDTSTVTTTASGETYTTVVAWPAKHARWVDQGRGPIEAAPGRMLRFETRSGEVIYRKRVGPARAQRFSTLGLAEAKPGIRQELDEATRRAVRRFEALS